MNQKSTQRRQFLRMLGVGGIAGAAGCLGDGGSGGAGTEAVWQGTTLEDATTGEPFRIDEFEVPTLVHTFATYCATCARQQDEFVTLWDRSDNLEIVELSVDPNDTAEDLATHAERAGLKWRVSVANETVLSSLIEEFGQEVSVSALSPVIIRCPDGDTNAASKISSPDMLEQAIEETC